MSAGYLNATIFLQKAYLSGLQHNKNEQICALLLKDKMLSASGGFAPDPWLATWPVGPAGVSAPNDMFSARREPLHFHDEVYAYTRIVVYVLMFVRIHLSYM